MSVPDPLIGSTIGSITIESRLGEGAMGIVYRGRHAGLKRPVALKMLGQRAGGNAKERFLREGRAAAKVRHPNVVQVYDAGEQNGVAFLAMELVHGHSLGSILDAKGRLDAEVVARLATGIIEGLSAIHAEQIVHRDIKPDNILLGADEVVKIADLGLAKTLDDPDLLRLTGTGMIVGTPLYVSPEAIRDPQNVTGKADIYSVGATLYHLLCGRPPFAHETAYDVMRAHLEERPAPVRSVRPDAPPYLATLIEDCLEKKADRRPDAQDLLVRLRHRRRSLPWRGLLAASLAGALLAGGGAAVGWWMTAGGGPGASSAAGEVDIRLASPIQPLRWQVGDGPWSSGPLRLIPGEHRIAVRSDRPGPLWEYRGSIVVTPGMGEWPVALARLPVRQRIELPGPGMLYREGEAVGLDQGAAVGTAGSWRFGRWDGAAWLSAEVDPGGARSAIAGPFSSPRGPAWWRTLDAQGAPLAQPYRVVCWYEADLLRRQLQAEAPRDWDRQGDRPQQPALIPPGPIGQALAMRLREALAGQARLPTSAEAVAFAGTAGNPLWIAEGASGVSTSGAGPAMLVMLQP